MSTCSPFPTSRRNEHLHFVVLDEQWDGLAERMVSIKELSHIWTKNVEKVQYICEGITREYGGRKEPYFFFHIPLIGQ